MKNHGRTSAEAMARYEVRNMGDGKGKKCSRIMIVGARRIEGERREASSVFQGRGGDQEILEVMGNPRTRGNGSSGGSGGSCQAHLSRRQIDRQRRTST